MEELVRGIIRCDWSCYKDCEYNRDYTRKYCVIDYPVLGMVHEELKFLLPGFGIILIWFC